MQFVIFLSKSLSRPLISNILPFLIYSPNISTLFIHPSNVISPRCRRRSILIPSPPIFSHHLTRNSLFSLPNTKYSYSKKLLLDEKFSIFCNLLKNKFYFDNREFALFLKMISHRVAGGKVLRSACEVNEKNFFMTGFTTMFTWKLKSPITSP